MKGYRPHSVYPCQESHNGSHSPFAQTLITAARGPCTSAAILLPLSAISPGRK